ncbi:MAG: hypothetical protein R3D58_18135 [Saprospiraceae bacterium]
MRRVPKTQGLGFQFRPFFPISIGGQAKHEHAGIFKAGLNFGSAIVAGLEFPFGEPDAQAVFAQALGDVAGCGAVFGAVA